MVIRWQKKAEGSTLPPVGVGSKSQEEGGGASQGDSTLPQVTRGQTPQHREHQELEAFSSAPNPIQISLYLIKNKNLNDSGNLPRILRAEQWEEEGECARFLSGWRQGLA